MGVVLKSLLKSEPPWLEMLPFCPLDALLLDDSFFYFSSLPLWANLLARGWIVAGGLFLAYLGRAMETRCGSDSLILPMKGKCLFLYCLVLNLPSL